MSIVEAQPDTPKPTRRWYRPTPDRLVIGLLAGEGVLLFSEWFHWFPKGYAVLLAVAGVAVVMLLMVLWFAAALLFRCWFQFSIRSLLVLTVAVAVPFSWLAVEMKAAKKQREVVEGIRGSGGWVTYDYQPEDISAPRQEPPFSAWLRKAFGDDRLADVVAVSVKNDAGLEQVKHLPRLRKLHFYGNNRTDVSLEHLKGLPLLCDLDLDSANVVNAEIEHLQGLTELQSLSLARNPLVSDDGLKYLRSLTRLQKLWLVQTSVTGEGLSHLKGLRHLEELYLGLSQANPEGHAWVGG